MIETIRELGERSLEDKHSLVEGLTLPVLKERDKRTQHVIKIDYSLKEKQINISFYEVSENTPIEYLWVGNADGANSPQWYGTTTNSEYLLNQTMPNLLERWDPEDSYFIKLQQALDTFFVELKTEKKSDERYKYIVKPSFFNAELAESGVKKARKEITKHFHAHLKEVYNFHPDDIALYTLAIDGELIVKQKEYHRLVLEEKESVFDAVREGICSVTNRKEQVTGTATKLQFKYYVNDKLNFASGISDKNYTKNMAIGRSAYRHVIAGEAFIQRNLSIRFGSLPCYIIPDFLYSPVDERLSVNNWTEAIQKLSNAANTLDAASRLESDIRNEIHRLDRMNRVALHFMFYVKAQSSFKVVKLIQDVPMKQVYELVKHQRDLEAFAKRLLGDGKWQLGLNQIYYLIPMKIRRGENHEKKKILAVYEALLSHKKLDYRWLITQFNRLAQIYHFDQFETTQIHQPQSGQTDNAFVRVMLQCQLLLHLLRQLQVISGVKVMVPTTIELEDEQMVAYMQRMKYNKGQSAMFLLGAIIASVAAEQQKELKNKAILNKVNYQGMNTIKIGMLSTDVFEKLRHYEILNFNEEIFSEHKRLFDSASAEGWPLSQQENVFYLLSGYAYKTKQIISKGKKKKNPKETKN